jgi:hypothetical protein
MTSTRVWQMQTTDTIQNSTVQPSSRAARGLGLVLAGGLIAGALDLTFAFVFYGLHGAAPLRILQGIASGVLGRGSYRYPRSSRPR